MDLDNPRENVGRLYAARLEEYQNSPGGRLAEQLELLGAPSFLVACGAVRWIAEHRVPVSGPLDIDATAEFLNVEVCISDEPGKYSQRGFLEGLGGDSPLRVVIDVNDTERAVTFGHEIGHAYLDRILGIKYQYTYTKTVESFCELFGKLFAMPPPELDEYPALEPRILHFLSQLYQVSKENITDIAALVA